MESEKKVSMNLSQKNIEPISFFEEYSDFVFIYKKTEKIASAIYIVTSLFSENEPMKSILRKKVSDFLSFNITYKDIGESSRVDFVYNIRTKVLELVSLLEISYRGGLVSSMNFSILKQELSNLSDLFSSSNPSPKNSFGEILTKAFFDVSEINRNLGEGRDIKSYHLSESLNISQKMSDTGIKDKSDFKRSNRQNIILGLLKKKKELTIKDIAQVIKDCSEKTIQRELISFIKIGVLKRTGERRWSRYSLNSS